MKQRKWSSFQIQNALSLSKKFKHSISGISINTKTLKKNNLFIPIKGQNHDGHKYVHEAFKKGASLSLSNKKGYEEFKLKKFKKKIILVKNPLSSLHKFASYSRKKIKGRIIGITGSVGKTSIKDALTFILNDKKKVQSSIGNFNNMIGMPLNLANFKEKIDVSILELGMNKKGEIKKLSNICKPDIGIITKISNAHLGNFNSLKDFALAKSEIFYGMKKTGTAIINKNDPNHFILEKILKKLKINNILTFGKGKKCDIRLINFKHNKNHYSSEVFLEVLGKKINFGLNNLGDHWVENSLAIASIITALNKNIEFYLKKLAKFNAIKGRGNILNIKFKNKKITLIDDSYNSSPESLNASIIFLNRLGYNKRKICVLGDMYELGKFSKKFHLKIEKVLKDNKISNVYTIGNEMNYLFNKLSKSINCKHSENLEELYFHLKENIKNDDIILFKGSRAMKLDKIIKKFY